MTSQRRPADQITIHDIARRAGVSPATVSRVINRVAPISKETLDRVQSVMEELNYHPSLLSRQFRRGQTGMIMVLVSDISNPFCTTVVRGIEHEAERSGNNLLICNSESSAVREAAYLKLLQGRAVDGVITMDAASRLSELHRMIGDRPWVQLGEFEASEASTFISVDNRKAAKQAIHHLAAKGRSRIAFINTCDGYRFAQDREFGYHEALSELNLEYHRVVYVSSVADFEQGCLALDQLWRDETPPDGIFTVSDALAVGVLSQAWRRDIDIPGQLSLIGFDGIPQSATTIPPLTTIAQPMFEMGQSAARLLIGRIAGLPAKSVHFECTLVERETC